MSIDGLTKSCYVCHTQKEEKEFHRTKNLPTAGNIYLCSRKCVNMWLLVMRKERSHKAAEQVPTIVLSASVKPNAQPKTGSLLKVNK